MSLRLRDVQRCNARPFADRHRVSPDAAKDNGEIRLLFNWADALKKEQ